jgi:glycosyltransferase involved in cell wall biosynthesis
MRISILVHNVYGVGGTNRTVINLAEGLIGRGHRVEIVSVLRRLDAPMLAVPATVPVVPMVDLRDGAADRQHPLARELSGIVPAEEEFSRYYSRLTDERVGDHLRRTKSDVVIGTRTALNLYVARLGRPDTVRVAQEHMTQSLIPPSVRAEMRRHYPALDAVVTVTEADAEAVRRDLDTGGINDGSFPVRAIPNSVPDPAIPPADGRGRIVVAAGRLDEIKRYDLLVRAFAKVVADRPDWRLRIYGDGGQLRPLAALVADLDLHNHVHLMGRYAPLEAEWVKGSIAAVTSDHESFGMTIVEAMRCGLPVVSTACPVGPAEIIADGEDGLLVPVGDPDAIATGLLSLINDDERRRRFAAAALVNARRYDPAHVSGLHESLFTELLRRRGRRPARSGPPPLRRLLTVFGRRGRTLQAPVGDCSAVGNRIVVSVPRGARLAFRARTDKRSKHLVRLPLTGGPTGSTASFDADSPLLAEGRWDLFLEDRDGRRGRLRAGLLDVRGLLGGCAETAPFTRNVPYRTADGYLAVGVWRRERHAELGELWYGAGVVTVHGRLVGWSFDGAQPRLLLTRRGEHPAELAVAGSTTRGDDFAFDVPLAALAARRLARHEDWDVAVRGAGGEPAPLARLMDDVIERKRVYAYPPVRVDEDLPLEIYEEHPAAEVRVKPYCTVGSGLAFVVSDRVP